MSMTPRPVRNPLHPRRFRHQCLGYPVPTDWLKKLAEKELGDHGRFAHVAILLLGAHPNFEFRKLRAVTVPGCSRDDKENEMICVPLAENTSREGLRAPPEDEVEAMRTYTGAEGPPLWYDVVC